MGTNIIRLPILLSLYFRSPSGSIVDLPSSPSRLNSTFGPPKFSGPGRFARLISSIARRCPQMAARLVENPVTSDLLATAITGAIALGLLRF